MREGRSCGGSLGVRKSAHCRLKDVEVQYTSKTGLCREASRREKLQWRIQKVRDSRNVAHLPRKAAGSEQG